MANSEREAQEALTAFSELVAHSDCVAYTDCVAKVVAGIPPTKLFAQLAVCAELAVKELDAQLALIDVLEYNELTELVDHTD